MSNKNKIISLSVLLVAILSLATYLIYDRISTNQENNKKEEKEEIKLKVSAEEKEEIRNKSLIIVGKEYGDIKEKMYNGNFISGLYGVITKDDLMKNHTLTDIDKLKIALDMQQHNPITIPTETIPFDFVREQATNGIFWQISQEDVDKQMNSLFGKTIKHQTVKGCPAYFYDETNKVYYGGAECGGTAPGLIYLYPTDFKKINEKTITVNVYAAFAAYESDNYITIYKSLNGYNSAFTETKIDTYKTEEYPFNNETNEFTGKFYIDEDNKENFEKYTLTFKKNENNEYVLKTIK